MGVLHEGGWSLLPAGGQQHLWSPVPACGHVLRQGLALRPFGGTAEAAGQAKVTELHLAAGIQENVGWLGRGRGLEGAEAGAHGGVGSARSVGGTFWSRWMTPPEWMNLVACSSW